jgi:iron complex outermembrane receptor protein
LSHSTNSFYGGIDAALTESVTASLHVGHTLFLRTGFDGIPVFPDGSPAGLPLSFCVCVKDMDLRSSVYYASTTLAWHATSMLELSFKGYFENQNTSGSINPYSYNLQTNGVANISVQQTKSGTAVNTAEGLHALYRFDDLGMKGSFLSLGLHREDFWSNGNGVSYQAGTATTNIFEGQAAFDQFIESVRPLMIFNPFTGPRLIIATTGGLQSLLQLSDPLALLLGASHSKAYASNKTEGVYSSFDFAGKTSYRAAFIYQLTPPVTAYLSYSQSFQPQTLYEPNFVPVPPLIGEQYEAGLKYTNHRVLVTGAVFQLTQANAAQFYKTIKNADFYLPVGEVKHKGVELEAVGEITGNWKVDAGYTYLDPKVSKDEDAFLVGQTELYLPTQTASAYLVYTFGEGVARGVSLGAGGRFVSSVRTSFDGSTRDIPGYSLVDASLGYARDKWLVNLNVRNVFNKHYFINEWQTLYYGNTFGAPTNVSLSARYEF